MRHALVRVSHFICPHLGRLDHCFFSSLRCVFASCRKLYDFIVAMLVSAADEQAIPVRPVHVLHKLFSALHPLASPQMHVAADPSSSVLYPPLSSRSHWNMATELLHRDFYLRGATRRVMQLCCF